MSLILQTKRTGLSDEDKNKSTDDILNATTVSKVVGTFTYSPAETMKGKKQRENSKMIYNIEATDFLYFARSIACRPNFWDVSFA